MSGTISRTGAAGGGADAFWLFDDSFLDDDVDAAGFFTGTVSFTGVTVFSGEMDFSAARPSRPRVAAASFGRSALVAAALIDLPIGDGFKFFDEVFAKFFDDDFPGGALMRLPLGFFAFFAVLLVLDMPERSRLGARLPLFPPPPRPFFAMAPDYAPAAGKVAIAQSVHNAAPFNS